MLHFCLQLVTLLAISIPASLEDGFHNPPAEARPRVWWHWEDGNVTKDGIRKDLEWFKQAGIGGYHHFDAGINQPPVVDHRLVYMHDDWKDAFRYAIQLSDSLGLTIGIASSPGWSNTGGPWVSKDDAMKRLVTSGVEVQGGQVEVQLPQPYTNEEYYKDIAVLAIPLGDNDGSIRSIRVYGNGSRQMWNIQPYRYNLVLEASDDGLAYREVCRIPQTTAPGISVNVPATRAAHFRLRNLDKGPVPEYELFSRSRIEHSEEKAGFSSPYDLASFKTSLEGAETLPSHGSVIDLTARMDEQGVLRWDAPEGSWRIIRFGYTLTGKRNGPAPREATGLEVDKLDRAAYRQYFRTYLDMYKETVGEFMGAKGITELLVDSYEAGWQTWTPSIAAEFESRRGYPLLPWLPVLDGEILDSPEASEDFLFDWRRTIAELYRDNYAQIKDIAAGYGIRELCLESQENGRVFVADGMDIKRHATVPMAACWTLVDNATSHSNKSIAIADIRESASVAHLYGQQWVAVESFTADGNEKGALSFTPAKLKRLADMEFSCGMNRLFIHESSHQPLDDCRPGLGLSKYGQWFNRHETWAGMASAWTDYLARTSFMLSQGQNIADVLVYYGEDTNCTARYGKTPFPVPDGYNYDFVNTSGLKDLKVNDGRITAPSGASYEVLCLDIDGLPQSKEAAELIEGLRSRGAVICTVEELQTRIGTVAKDVCAPSFFRFVHRRTEDGDIYWLDNPTDGQVNSEFSFRCTGREPSLWNPETGTISPVSYRMEDGRCFIPLCFNADDAVFVVFSGDAPRKSFNVRSTDKPLTKSVEIRSWAMNFPHTRLEVDGLRDYTSFIDEETKYFSGICRYESTIQLDKVPSQAVLDLGQVHDLCRVTVNGKDMGILWRSPFKLDISSALKEGSNTIEVALANVWVNRLIGDAQMDCKTPHTYTTGRFYSAHSPLLEAGLLGPVILNYR